MTRRGAVALLAFVAAGCGFRLRRWNIGAAFQSARIDADRSVDLDGDLAQALESVGVPVASGEAEVVLTLTQQRDERRRVVANRVGRAAEYELALQVEFAVSGSNGEQLAPARLLRSERVVLLDRDNIVGSSEEQALVQREIRNDLVDRMMRTLGTLSRGPNAAPAE